MAKKFGKRSRTSARDIGPVADPRNMFGAPPVPRQAYRPASSTPLADHLDRGHPGVDQGYVVIPRSIAEGMSLPWQQQLVNLLDQFHQTHGTLPWPEYRVVPSRYEYLVDLDEEQLAEAGYLVEIDSGGEMVYRERSGRRVDEPEETRVLVPCLDPIVRGRQPQSRPVQPPPQPQQPPPVTQAPLPSSQQPQQQPPPPEPGPVRQAAPMNIGPQPVWPRTGAGTTGTSGTGTAPAASSAPGFRGVAGAQQVSPDRGTDTGSTPPSGFPAPGGQSSSGDGRFGPSGEPTEIPYRYRG